jgi:hypothetical protein
MGAGHTAGVSGAFWVTHERGAESMYTQVNNPEVGKQVQCGPILTNYHDMVVVTPSCCCTVPGRV